MQKMARGRGQRGVQVCEEPQWDRARQHHGFDVLRGALHLSRLLEEHAVEGLHLANRDRTPLEEETLARILSILKSAVRRLEERRTGVDKLGSRDRLEEGADHRAVTDDVLERDYRRLAEQVLPELKRRAVARGGRGTGFVAALHEILAEELGDSPSIWIACSGDDPSSQVVPAVSLVYLAAPAIRNSLSSLRTQAPATVAHEVIAILRGTTPAAVRDAVTNARRRRLGKRPRR
jgi:hypothetical protein